MFLFALHNLQTLKRPERVGYGYGRAIISYLGDCRMKLKKKYMDPIIMISKSCSILKLNLNCKSVFFLKRCFGNRRVVEL